MKLSATVTGLLALIAGELGSARAEAHSGLLEDLQHRAMESLKQVESDNPSTTASKCSIGRGQCPQGLGVYEQKERKRLHQRRSMYHQATPHSDPNEVPGARTRYDDFVAQHINQTFTSHGTGNFLGFHRYYIYGYEKALREECGYQGSQPYWNWFAYQNNLKDSPVFDGSETSMGGDGSFVQHNGSVGGIGLYHHALW
ncbi:hypothetical protein BKA70DRAFT_787499 [Coprinopsis sp. MPI-PUGE-AT-0042]|nr:hypothetical protein BKA70DRAFT_787499 [Coprinopsis sp. MPI-PUGE-AT-0042]